MRERLNRHAWRACDPRKGSVGSNPTLSASKARFGDTDWELALLGRSRRCNTDISREENRKEKR